MHDNLTDWRAAVKLLSVPVWNDGRKRGNDRTAGKDRSEKGEKENYGVSSQRSGVPLPVGRICSRSRSATEMGSESLFSVAFDPNGDLFYDPDEIPSGPAVSGYDPGAGRKRREEGGLSPVQTLFVSTATRVGMGNLVGVVAAISAGGAGAVF